MTETEKQYITQAGNRAYYKYRSITKSKSRKTKMGVYKVAIQPVVTYGAGTMILTKGEEEKLKRLERKIVRKLYSSKREMKGVY